MLRVSEHIDSRYSRGNDFVPYMNLGGFKTGMRQKRSVSFNSRAGSGRAVVHHHMHPTTTTTTKRSSSSCALLVSAESLEDDGSPSSVGNRSDLSGTFCPRDASIEHDGEASALGPLIRGDRNFVVANRYSSSQGLLLRPDKKSTQWNRNQYKKHATEVAALLSTGPGCDGDTGSLRGFRKPAEGIDGTTADDDNESFPFIPRQCPGPMMDESSPTLKPRAIGSNCQVCGTDCLFFASESLLFVCLLDDYKRDKASSRPSHAHDDDTQDGDDEELRLFRSFMPQELMLQVLSRLSPRDMPSVGAVSRTMRSLERKFATESFLLLLSPTPMRLSCIKPEHRLDMSKWPLLVKNSRPGRY